MYFATLRGPLVTSDGPAIQTAPSAATVATTKAVPSIICNVVADNRSGSGGTAVVCPPPIPNAPPACKVTMDPHGLLGGGSVVSVVCPPQCTVANDHRFQPWDPAGLYSICAVPQVAQIPGIQRGLRPPSVTPTAPSIPSCPDGSFLDASSGVCVLMPVSQPTPIPPVAVPPASSMPSLKSIGFAAAVFFGLIYLTQKR